MGRLLIAYMIGALATAVVIKDVQLSYEISHSDKVVMIMAWPLLVYTGLERIFEEAEKEKS